MNAVEIEEAISLLAEQPFNAAEFPFEFLAAFGNKETTLKRLRAEGRGGTNQSDIPGAILQRGNIHLKTCEPGQVAETLKALRESKKTATLKAKFILATDGIELQAESLEGEGETLACEYAKFADHFGFFLPLAGISTVRQIRENAFDIKATGRLNRLYIELLKDNPEWATAARREDLNHFMARVIFCFFAEDTNIFHSDSLFTATVEQMSARDSSNTHEVISELFRAMNTRLADREKARIRSWANVFPYVNGGLFSDSVDVPKFSKIARSYLLHVGNLDWTKINPDIFGSMIQAVADDEERGALGMHYTSVPNILKVLNPLFLDDLREKLAEAGNGQSPGSLRKLLNLRHRIARIRVFDPACGSGNFLVIAYKEMRAIEAEINRRRGEAEIKSIIPLTNFRGIELRHFSCEIARLALIIAEYQCDVLYRGQQLALAEFLPLEAANWITCGNALRLDWLSICPPTGKGVKNRADDLFETPLDQAEIDFENEGGETYICGNPPYLGSKRQEDVQKSDLRAIFEAETENWRSLDYVAGWFKKAADFATLTETGVAFVATNSVCQGQQASILWPLIFQRKQRISFAHSSFNWRNLASKNAGVTVVIVGFSSKANGAVLFEEDDQGEVETRRVASLNAYLIPAADTFVESQRFQLSNLPTFDRGNSPTDGGGLLLDSDSLHQLQLSENQVRAFIRPFVGSMELIRGISRFCLWIDDTLRNEAEALPSLQKRFEDVRRFRLASSKAATVKAAAWPHRFDERKPLPETPVICVPITSSENREFLPAGLLEKGTVVSNLAFAMPCKDLWVFGLVVSKMLLSWVAAVCARMRTDYRFTNTLCWNTFPVPPLTEQNKADLTRCAEEILLAREAHFPATIADLYDPEKMPADLRAAHDRNDETLERIYIGRRFKNDTERLEKLFELYTKMTAHAPAKKAGKRAKSP